MDHIFIYINAECEVFYLFCAFNIVKIKDFIHYGLGNMEIGLINYEI